MGCDIHGWVEVKVGNKYVATKQLVDRERNYKRFAALAGVRDYDGSSKAEPKGVPTDVSDAVKRRIESFGSDGHSHSYLPLVEAAHIFLKTAYEASDYDQKYPASTFFGYEENDLSKARLVFWFDC